MLKTVIYVLFQTSALDVAEFAHLVEWHRENFHHLHYEYENSLRQVRLDVSENFRVWNTDVLRIVANKTTDILFYKNIVYSELLERANELGNQNECIIRLDGETNDAAYTAGFDITQCVHHASLSLSEATEELLFDFIREVQLESTLAQSYHFFELANYNPLLQQQNILDSMESVYGHGADILYYEVQPYFDAEIVYFRALAAQSVGAVQSCLDILYSEFSTTITDIRNALINCS